MNYDLIKNNAIDLLHMGHTTLILLLALRNKNLQKLINACKECPPCTAPCDHPYICYAVMSHLIRAKLIVSLRTNR